MKSNSKSPFSVRKPNESYWDDQDRLRSLNKAISRLEIDLKETQLELSEEKENNQRLSFKLFQNISRSPVYLEEELSQLQKDKIELLSKFTAVETILQKIESTESSLQIQHQEVTAKFESLSFSLKQLQHDNETLKKQIEMAELNCSFNEYEEILETVRDTQNKISFAVLKEKKIRGVLSVVCFLSKAFRTRFAFCAIQKHAISKHKIMGNICGILSKKIQGLKKIAVSKLKTKRNLRLAMKIAERFRMKFNVERTFEIKKKRIRVWKYKVLLKIKREMGIFKMYNVHKKSLKRALNSWRNYAKIQKIISFNEILQMKSTEYSHLQAKNSQSQLRLLKRLEATEKIKESINKLMMKNLFEFNKIKKHEISKVKAATLLKLLTLPRKSMIYKGLQAFISCADHYRNIDHQNKMQAITQENALSLASIKQISALNRLESLGLSRARLGFFDLTNHKFKLSEVIKNMNKKCEFFEKFKTKHVFTKWSRIAFVSDIDELCERHESLRVEKEHLEEYLEDVHKEIEKCQNERQYIYFAQFKRFINLVTRVKLSSGFNIWSTEVTNTTKKLRSCRKISSILRKTYQKYSFAQIMIVAIRKHNYQLFSRNVQKNKTNSCNKFLTKVLKNWKYSSKLSILCKKYILRCLKTKSYNQKNDAFKIWKTCLKHSYKDHLNYNIERVDLDNVHMNHQMITLLEKVHKLNARKEVIRNKIVKQILSKTLSIFKNRSTKNLQSKFLIWKSKNALIKHSLKSFKKTMLYWHQKNLTKAFSDFKIRSSILSSSMSINQSIRTHKTKTLIKNILKATRNQRKNALRKWHDRIKEYNTLELSLGKMCFVLKKHTKKFVFSDFLGKLMNELNHVRNKEKARTFRNQGVLFKLQYIILVWKQMAVHGKRAKLSLIRVFKRKNNINKSIALRYWIGFIDHCRLTILRTNWSYLNIEKGELHKKMSYFNLMLEESKAIEQDLAQRLKKTSYQRLGNTIVRGLKKKIALGFYLWKNYAKYSCYPYESPNKIA